MPTISSECADKIPKGWNGPTCEELAGYNLCEVDWNEVDSMFGMDLSGQSITKKEVQDLCKSSCGNCKGIQAFCVVKLKLY